ncbi:alaserpin-like [Hyposmocoma kahamanoa]|uniref:alaserpin-like n=1 Tax=Hyposmocoma kahamanoa TaxID=1477025 RepID=UPI000E6D7121|nr:alaserpin-like [Hyposmocoma kahamanoa]
MNKWVENQTDHRIKNLVAANDLDASTCSILLNAIYFKGNWNRPFDKENTKDEDFHVSKDQTITVPMMHNNTLFKYAKSSELNAQLLEMPYKRHEATFIVILPNEVDGLTALEDKLRDPTALEKAMLQMNIYDVNVSLPRFKIESKIDLKDVLAKMKVNRIFDPEQAQLNRLLKNKYNLYVSKAIQKAFIEVNEIGTEAAAANKFELMTGWAGPSPTSSFIADKPFYYGLNIGHTTVLSGRYMGQSTDTRSSCPCKLSATPAADLLAGSAATTNPESLRAPIARANRHCIILSGATPPGLRRTGRAATTHRDVSPPRPSSQRAIRAVPLTRRVRAEHPSYRASLPAMAQQDVKELDQFLEKGNNQFTAKMYCEVIRANPCKNMVMSAFSALVPLAQLSLASEGASHDELLQIIGLPNDNTTKVVFSNLNKKLQAIEGIVLKTASKIYVAVAAELNPEFSAAIKDIFNSEVENVDFSKNTEAANKMNRWVENQTDHRIKDLISANDLDANISSILLNAIYFKGNWNEPFEKEKTKEEDFHVSKDQTITVPMMHNNAKFLYANSSELNAQLLEMPYKRHEATFIVILPNEVDGLTALEEKLGDPAALDKAVLQMKIYDVNVSLPKFKIESKIDLKDILEEMKVKRIFDPKQAQLNRLLKNQYELYVNKAIQKAFIEVNEIGTEAAAANEFELMVGSGPPAPKSSFIADKPFYYGLNIGHTTILSGRYTGLSTNDQDSCSCR